jgi:hypothetical protein
MYICVQVCNGTFECEQLNQFNSKNWYKITHLQLQETNFKKTGYSESQEVHSENLYS